MCFDSTTCGQMSREKYFSHQLNKMNTTLKSCKCRENKTRKKSRASWKDSSSDQGTHFHLSVPLPYPLFVRRTVYKLLSVNNVTKYSPEKRLRIHIYQGRFHIPSTLSLRPTNNTNTVPLFVFVHHLFACNTVAIGTK